MRIAFCGSHRVGKSTLIESVAGALPGYTTVTEPYELLEEDGHELSDPPSLEGFEAQLARSIEALEAEDGADVLFDRCPFDIVAYLETHADAEAFDVDDWLPRARKALRTLDLMIFVPIEDPDRVALPASEDRAFRRAVHERLEELLAHDALGSGVEVLTVRGDLPTRVERVLSRIR